MGKPPLRAREEQARNLGRGLNANLLGVGIVIYGNLPAQAFVLLNIVGVVSDVPRVVLHHVSGVRDLLQLINHNVELFSAGRSALCGCALSSK